MTRMTRMARVIKARHLFTALVTVLALVPPAASADAGSTLLTGHGHDGGAHWTGTWETAPSGTAPALPGVSIRNVVHTSVGGSAARVRVSNRLGTAPLQLDGVTVALQEWGRPTSPNAAPGSLRVATFAGRRSVTIPVGQDMVSDPVDLLIPADANLLVSVHTPADSGPATYHRSAFQANFLSRQGDRTADEPGTAYTVTLGNWYYVTGVDVLDAPAAGSVVAFGDSLTDGTGSTSSANRRWPDLLAARLRTLPAHLRLGVLNAGISGNRLLLEAGGGPSALARLDADALSRAGVRTMIVLEGINDIKGTPEQRDPLAIEDVYRRIVARAHARGIRVVGATITPYGGYGAYTESREAVRLTVNAFIRNGALFDAVVDFDAVVRDPADPHRIRPAYDPGDHLHFNDTGMQALADGIDLGTLLG
ncbi:SGNH/GDSL hydrolase family protein [Streptomyces sp. NBC_01340]|uniref:SGNH/GDSL hydrolase family protein n=2 Tax=Streptomyces TaxID=1883 RepID=UPI0022595023|nr:MULTISPECIES: SGNH/GDSL hydrolase family protein [unclassified Streptomyces]MCX4457789.1 SGNH/GDSL hydrolase family protein [Streptomyces sp. NBC_01719]MCX4497146.1 SGNH/GDSL hydrolase family protein [Streptomyces sp. NBC_01728]WSI42005.1 SGNH/GDSL hydrolase family protein [Streptomyces sp. NBC_01340]